MSSAERLPYAVGFKFLGIALDILIFAFIGYFIGKNFNQEVLGALIGALFGTALTWYYLLRLARKV